MREDYYTGVGSRITPEPILITMEQTAELLYDAQYILRSGGAIGADSAFEKGVDRATQGFTAGFSGKWKRIYVPWKGYRDRPDDIYRIHKKAFTIASRIHPAWNKLSDGDKRLHARNVHQVLGEDLKTPSQFLICWTPYAGLSGGTRTAIVLAQEVKIPVYNLGSNQYGLLTAKQLVERILSDVRSGEQIRA